MRTYKPKEIEFIAWDGEGVTDHDTGQSRYIILRNSTGAHITRPTGLSTEECLRFIHNEAHAISGPTRRIHVIFGGSYDVNMLLCDLARDEIWKLWSYGHVQWKDYHLRYIHRKSFTVSRRNHENDAPITTRSSSSRKNIRRAQESLTLWDVFGFFQSTFVDAMQKYLSDYDPEKLQSIITHKTQRSDFKEEDIEDIDAYCTLEIDALVQIMEKLHGAVQHTELSLSRWDGAGAIAQALLRKYGIKGHMRDFSQGNSTDKRVHQEAWRAYAGGRIECCQYGHALTSVWHGDINSAYPSACLSLPSFRSGQWEHTTYYQHDCYGLWRVRFDFSGYPPSTIYPFFYRDPTGAISYPKYGQGSYWQPEVAAALKHFADGVTILEGWIWRVEIASNNLHQTMSCNSSSVSTVWTMHDTSKPFAFVADIYQQRLRFKQQRNAAQMILKLGMNSLYGKLAQQIGYRKNEKPAFQQIEWAGYITSSVRATLFDVAMQHADSVVMFATDGLFSTHTHTVPEGKELGEWEAHVHDDMIVAQSGVYWYRDGDTWTDKFRGFDREDLTWQAVLDAFQSLHWNLTAKSRRFVTMGASMQSLEMWGKWRMWPESLRTLQLIAHGTKRTDVQPWWTPTDNPSLHLFPTRPLINEYAIAGVLSAVYRKNDRVALAKRLDQEEQDGFL